MPQLKSKILNVVSETKDENLLKVVWNVLRDYQEEAKEFRLSKHIQTIFERYPKTLEKLAQ